jgi:hypothetical protein
MAECTAGESGGREADQSSGGVVEMSCVIAEERDSRVVDRAVSACAWSVIRAGRPDGKSWVRALSCAVVSSHGPMESGFEGSKTVVLSEATLLMIDRARSARSVWVAASLPGLSGRSGDSGVKGCGFSYRLSIR